MFRPVTLVAVGALEAYGRVRPRLPHPRAVASAASSQSVRLHRRQHSCQCWPRRARSGSRLALVVAAATSRSAAAEDSHEIEACVIAHACLLQPLCTPSAAPAAAHLGQLCCLPPREALVAAIRLTPFQPRAVHADAGFVACASLLAAGVVLTLVAAILDSCRRGTSVDNATGGVERTMSGGGAAPLLFDETRHQLSPTAKRLLA